MAYQNQNLAGAEIDPSSVPFVEWPLYPDPLNREFFLIKLGTLDLPQQLVVEPDCLEELYMRGHSDQPEDQQSLMETHRNQDHLTCQTSRRHLDALAEALLANKADSLRLAGAASRVECLGTELVDPSLLDHLRLFFRVRLVEHLVAEKATELMEEKATELVEDRLGETALGCRHLRCLDCRHLSFLGHLDAVPYLDHLEADQ